MIRDTHTLFDFGIMAQGYDGWYETADGKAHDHQQKAAVMRVLPSPAGHAKLLDVGCGTGHWSRFFASRGFRVTGIDASPEMVSAARAPNTPARLFGIADACSLPFGDGSFDVVAAMAAIEFISDAKAAVAEMFRCVRKGGAVIIGTLNRLAPLNRNRVANRKEPYSSARLFSPTELRDLLALYGSVDMWVTDSGVKDDESGQSGAFIVAKACWPECGNAVLRRKPVEGVLKKMARSLSSTKMNA